jgi:hypothetical protein
MCGIEIDTMRVGKAGLPGHLSLVCCVPEVPQLRCEVAGDSRL